MLFSYLSLILMYLRDDTAIHGKTDITLAKSGVQLVPINLVEDITTESKHRSINQ